MLPKILLLLSGMTILDTSFSPVFAEEKGIFEPITSSIKSDPVPPFKVTEIDEKKITLSFTSAGLEAACVAENVYAVTIKSYLEEFYPEFHLDPDKVFTLTDFLKNDLQDVRGLKRAIHDNLRKKKIFNIAMGIWKKNIYN